MERLTGISKITDFYMPIKLQESCGESDCKEICKQYVGDYCIGCPVQECMTRLAEYENTGLTPDEIKEQIEILKHNYKRMEDTLERQYDNALKMVNKLEKDCDYWKREALKWANELGNQKIERGK